MPGGGGGSPTTGPHGNYLGGVVGVLEALTASAGWGIKMGFPLSPTATTLAREPKNLLIKLVENRRSMPA